MPALLSTKIQLPPTSTQHLHRKRLMQHIEANRDTRLILVSAPAGFGKSSCLIDWAHRRRKNGAHVAWYALDEHDNDPARFAAHLLGAFSYIDTNFPSPLDNVEQTSPRETVNHIVNTIAETNNPTLLVLDDYHLIAEPQIHDAINLLAEYLPENTNLAIGTRADPPLPLARWRSQGKVAEIRMADLRFQEEEASLWVQAALGWTPSSQLLRVLNEVTEGWAAALALIMMSQTEGDQQAFERQLSLYSVSQRRIFDYFAQEVFDQQSNEIQEFLLDTCVLNRLQPHLCSALTDNCSAPLLLNQIATRSLFVIPLSETEPVYRYHQLFQEYLRQHLQMHDQSRYLHQHRLAAEWYAKQDDMVEAVYHALASEDFGYAAHLIESHAWETLTARGEIMTVIHWLPRFSEKALKRHPQLCLYFSRALYLIGDIERSQSYLQLATEVLDQNLDDHHEQQSLQAIAFNYQATLAAYRGDVAAGQAWIEKSNALHDHVDALDQVRIANTDAFLQYLIGDVPKARCAYEDALDLARQIDHHYLMLDAHYYLAQIDLLAGELQAAQVRCEGVLEQYRPEIGPVSAVMLPLASVHYQRNQLVDAEAILRDAIRLARRGNIPDVLWLAHLSLAEVLLTRNEIAEAKSCLAEAHRYSAGFHSPIMASFIAASEATLMLRSNQLDDVIDWANRYQATERTRYHQDFENLTLARIWLSQQDHERALKLLTQVLGDAQQAGRMGTVITAEMLQALAHQSINEIDAALTAIDHALTLAQPQGFVRIFLDTGQSMITLLRLAAAHDVGADYAEYLLKIANQPDTIQHPADLLTEREIEVLGHIAEGASNQAIADTLVISLGTVKSHIHHIMDKLDAQNRTEAVSNARSLNILHD